MSHTHPRSPALLVVPLALATAGACAPAPSSATDGALTPARNVLLIGIDTLRADHLGALGYARPTSPNLDRLLARAVVFEAAQSSSSWTLPSFASLMTSLHTSTHGCWSFDHRLDDSFTTLAEILSDAGHHTAAVVSHVFLGSRYGLHQGFADYDETLVKATLRDSHRAISSPEVTDRAIERLERWAGEGTEPWFLFVHYFDPHKGYREHEVLQGRFRGPEPVDRYDGEIAFTDLHIGRLLERLEGLGAAEETIVVLVADHGEEFGEHGGTEHGKTLHREVLRVPLALAIPGVAPRRVREPVSLLDLVPTLLDVLGLDAPRGPLAGRSRLPELLGRAGDEGGVLAELEPVARGRGGGALRRLRAYRTARWKLIVEGSDELDAGERFQLFDPEADPGEREDLAPSNPEVVRRLSAALAEEVRRAEALAKRFGEARELELTTEELQRLRDLGYAGDEGSSDER